MQAPTMIRTPATCHQAEIELISDVMRTSNTFNNAAASRKSANM